MNGPPPLPGRSRRGRILLFVIVGLALTPVLLVVGWYVGIRVSNARAVRQLEARVRAKGEPLKLTDLAGRYSSIPDAENAAIPLLELWEKEDPAFWRAFRQGQRQLPERSRHEWDPALPFLGQETKRVARTGPLAMASQAAAEEYLERRSEHLQVVRLALCRPRCQSPTDMLR